MKSTITLSPKVANEIEELLREDVAWAVARQTWDPAAGAHHDGERWMSQDEPYEDSQNLSSCGGVCAIGALCVRRQVPVIYPRDGRPFVSADVRSAAEFLKVPSDWLDAVYYGVMYGSFTGLKHPVYAHRQHRSPQAWDMGRRLAAYARTLGGQS